MHNKAQAGFTLLEIIVALLIVGIMLTVAIPRFNRSGALPIDDLLVNLNTLCQEGAQQATSEGAVYKVTFNFKAKPSRVELSTGNKRVTSIVLPDSLVFEQLYINRKVEPGREEAWFFIAPDGTAQEVIINLRDTQQQANRYSLVLNPFTVQFKRYGDFQRPQGSA